MTMSNADPLDGVIAEAARLLNGITPGEWCVWDGLAYVGGGKDLCIGAGGDWLANMDHRHCQNYAHHIGCHDEGCALEKDANIIEVCTGQDVITAEQQANADFIAAAPRLVRDLLQAVQSLSAQIEDIAKQRAAISQSTMLSDEAFKASADRMMERHRESLQRLADPPAGASRSAGEPE